LVGGLDLGAGAPKGVRPHASAPSLPPDHPQFLSLLEHRLIHDLVVIYSGGDGVGDAAGEAAAGGGSGSRNPDTQKREPGSGEGLGSDGEGQPSGGPSVHSVLALGIDVCGHPRTVHGGLTSAVFDET
jgi:hypothetical protein